MKEIITVQIGSSGNSIGETYWKEVASEHSLCSKSSESSGDTGVLFSERRLGTVQRSIICDLSSSDTRKLAGSESSPDRENIILSAEGSGNCYAAAFHTAGPPVAQRVVERVRRELERCDSIHGIQFLHSTIGGTGSGLSGLLMKSLHEYIDGGSKCMFVSGCLVPPPSSRDSLLSIFNTVLCFQDLSEYCHLVIPFDIQALSSRPLGPFTSFAKCISGLSASMRFPGALNTDIRKIHSHLVPFKNANFLVPSIASSQEESILDLTLDALDRDSPCLSIDPQLENSRYLATLLSYRGKALHPSQVDHVTKSLQKSGSKFDEYFPDWIPNSISASIAASDSKMKSPDEVSLTTFSNNTGIHQLYDNVLNAWDKQFKARSHVHIFEANGIHADEMLEARNLVQYVSDQYKEYSVWQDKILIKSDNSCFTLNQPSITSSTQRNIAEELLQLNSYN